MTMMPKTLETKVYYMPTCMDTYQTLRDAYLQAYQFETHESACGVRQTFKATMPSPELNSFTTLS